MDTKTCNFVVFLLENNNSLFGLYADDIYKPDNRNHALILKRFLCYLKKCFFFSSLKIPTLSINNT